MPTAYPGGTDDFEVTTDPGNTALSQRGTGGNRNHVESHTDLGDAIEALQNYAALKTHDHSGSTGNPADRAKGYQLDQANTHQNADTNSSASAIHHTLGTGQYQAAAGNHTHAYSAITGTPWIACTSGTRPSGVAEGTVIYETDTKQVRILRDSSWLLTTLGRYPILRLRQSSNQNISSTGTLLQWNEKQEDATSMVAGSTTTTVTIQEPGLYQFDAAIQWNPNYVPENATGVITVNNSETDLKNTAYQKQGLGFLLPAGFVQTLPLSGALRLSAGAVVALKCSYTAPGSILGFITSFFDSPSQVKSRLDIRFIAP